MAAIPGGGNVNGYGLVFHHLGLATKTPQAATAMLAGLGYRIGETVLDPQQNVHLILCEGESLPAVEVISPATGQGPVDGLLARHPAGLIYHLCFATADLATSLRQIEVAGVHASCVLPPTPAVLFQGRRVSFHMVNGFGLIEILEPAPAAGPPARR